MDDRAIGRAAFLGLVGAGVAGLFFGRDATQLIGRIVPDQVVSIVPTRGWRIYTIGNSIPRIDPASYRLTIAGAVERPVDLHARRPAPRCRPRQQVSDFHCVTGWSVDDVHWRGVRFADLLARGAAAQRRRRRCGSSRTRCPTTTR